MPFLIDSNVLIDVSRGNVGREAYRLLKAYAKSDRLHVFDSLIAATAIERDLTLITLNQKHYRMIAGLQLEEPDY